MVSQLGVLRSWLQVRDPVQKSVVGKKRNPPRVTSKTLEVKISALHASTPRSTGAGVANFAEFTDRFFLTKCPSANAPP